MSSSNQELVAAQALAAVKGDASLQAGKAVVTRGEQTFAVFGDVARDVTPWADRDSDGHVAIVDGLAWCRALETGQVGVLMVVHDHRKGRWIACWPPLRWLWAAELHLTDAEIEARVSASIEATASVTLTT